MPGELTERLVELFRWIDPGPASSHLVSDISGWWRDPEVLAELGPALVAPFRAARPTVVVAPAVTGLLLGPLAATAARGRVRARTQGRRRAPTGRAAHLGEESAGLPGPAVDLAVRDRHLGPGDRVLVVDDWVRTGAQLHALYRHLRGARRRGARHGRGRRRLPARGRGRTTDHRPAGRHRPAGLTSTALHLRRSTDGRRHPGRGVRTAAPHRPRIRGLALQPRTDGRRGAGPARVTPQHVHRWLDDYLPRLDELPRGLRPIDDWRAALGDPKRAGDWLAYFDRQVREHPWRDVLGTWWPRLLPGIAAGATHGVIRVGHAVRALRHERREPPAAHRARPGPRLLGGPLAAGPRHRPPARPGTRPGRRRRRGPPAADVAARWPGCPGSPTRPGASGTDWASCRAYPTGSRQSRRCARRTARPRRSGASPTLVHRAGLDYLRFGHAAPVMLVHAVTAPTAVLRTLPGPRPGALGAEPRRGLGRDGGGDLGVRADRTGSRPPTSTAATPAEVFARAARNGDAHVVKLADAVLDAYAATGDERLLAAAGYAGQLI